MNQIQIMLKDTSFLKKTVTLLVPVTLQNLLNNLLNLVDTYMITDLGETSIAAVGLANKVFFVFILLMFGISSGSAILAAQYYGKRDLLGIKRVLRMSLIIGVSTSFLFVIPSLLFPEIVMKIFTTKQEMITIGASFLGVVAISFPITAVTNCYVAILRSMNYVKRPVIITTIAIAVNITLNYGLIYGKWGLPQLGVVGSALATVISRILELSMLLLCVWLSKPGDDGVGDFIHAKLDKIKEKKEAFLNKAFLKIYFNTASPVIANEFIWGLGVTMYSAVYGRMGDEATAAITISNSVEQMVMVFFFGLCGAAAVILGNELGAGNLKKAEVYAKNFMILQIMISAVGTILTLVFADSIVSIFHTTEIVSQYIKHCLIAFALYIPIRALDTLFIVAILRSGGDTKAALFLDVSGVWLIGIPMAVIGGLVLHLPIYIVYAMVMVEEIYKAILGYARYRKKKWLKNIVAVEVKND